MKKALPFLLLPLLGCQHVGLRTAEGALIAGAAYEFADNRGARLSRMADAVEHRMPLWAQYDTWGDPITWLHHALWTAIACTGLGGIGEATGSGFRQGCKEGAWLAVGFYGIREALSPFHENECRGAFVDRCEHPEHRRGAHLGWVLDGVGDVGFPALFAWLVP